jgi:hypothetical protein
MRISRILLCLSYLFIPCLCLNIWNPTFKDPYSSLDTLIDVDVETNCVSNVRITVTVPTTSLPSAANPTLGNAHFIGSPFVDKTLTGTSHWSHGLPATVHVSFDGSTFTFFDFIAGESAGPGIRSRPADPWKNLNFDILDADFQSQTLLTLVLNDDAAALDPDQTPFINLNVPDYFTAAGDGTRCGDNGVNGDPVFSGFQGQVFQFHGLPDEHFNLVSSPDVQLNAHFVYLSSGKCDYNDTECFTHPGTYMDILGFSVADTHIKLVAGTHEQGLRIWINDQEITRGTYIRAITNTTAYIKYHHNGHVEIRTEIMNFDITNSDMFMNIHVALNNRQLLHVGAIKHTVTDHKICRTNSDTHNHQLIESTVAAKYPVTIPLHGLIGQTWRNVKVCNRDWMGTTEDYIASDLFAKDYHYNYYKW